MWKSSLLLCLILQSGETSVQELLARIEALEKRVQELEAERRPPVPPAPAPPAPASLNAGSHNGSDPQQAALPAAAALPQYPSLELRGFSDIDFSGSDQKGTHSGFSEGQFTLHLVSALAPKVNFFSEITLSARRDAGLGGAPGFNPKWSVPSSVSIRAMRSKYPSAAITHPSIGGIPPTIMANGSRRLSAVRKWCSLAASLFRFISSALSLKVRCRPAG